MKREEFSCNKTPKLSILLSIMSTLHFDSRILPSCHYSFEPLAGRDLPFAHVYYVAIQLRRELLSEDSFQQLVYGVLNGIGKAAFLTPKDSQEMFAAQKGRFSVVVTKTIQATAQGRIQDLEGRLCDRTPAINQRIQARIKLVKDGEAFLHSYLGKEVIFKTPNTREDIEKWKQNHLEAVFGVKFLAKFSGFDLFQRLVSEKFSIDDKARLSYWEQKVVKGAFRMVRHPNVGDVVCYLGCFPFVEGVVDESGKIDVNGNLHTLFEREEYGKKVLFLREYAQRTFESLSE